ncbi:MAG: archease [Nanoarchaeota archaeon]|nr:archease [Nanoarchaeota archaeon]MBU1269297.1 archease [Nanoarchaeota archaeon]MBU1603766.1 archease [Nanoarchaeota archaeon]MBU2443891.1 archease [Nanoarchaeota archaeon]
MKFEYLEDVATADIAFRARGKNLNELFENCALATTDTMVDTKTVKPKVTKTITLEHNDLEQLLFLFLSEITYFKDAELLFFSKFKVNIDGNKLKAKMYGEKFNNKVIFRNDVKAITMHMLKVEKKKENYYATVVLDI